MLSNTGEDIDIIGDISDEDVENALELYLTCSSEWLKLLPGVLVFDVPEGEGEIELQLQLEEGFKLKLNIEGKGTVSITQVSEGKAKIQYQVLEQTHVIVYLQAEENPSSAPARRIKAAKADASVKAAVKSIKITPKNAPTGYEFISNGDSSSSNKVLQNGHIYIFRGEKTYTVTGSEIK